MSTLNKINNHQYQEFILVTVLSTILVISFFLLGKFITYRFEFMIDSAIYLKMSYQPFTFISSPYSYRILTPLLVYLLPFEHLMGFIVVNLSATISTLVLLFYYLKKLDFTKNYRVLGVLFFFLAPSVLYLLVNITLVDSLSYFFFLLAFYAILIKSDKLYLITLLLGILNKETILFTLPLFFICKLDSGILKALKSTLLISLPALLIFFYVRYSLGLVNYLSLDEIVRISSNLFHSLNLFNNPFPAFGTLWIISFFSIRNIDNPFIKKSIYLIPLILLQLFIATDSFRALFLAFPIIIPMSMYLNKVKNNKIILVLIILSLTILISYIMMVNNSATPYFTIFLFLPLEILVIGFLLIIFINNALKKNSFLTEDINQ